MLEYLGKNLFHQVLISEKKCQPQKVYSSFTKLWQSCSDPHPKISPIAIFAFYSLNYSLVARLQDNSRPKSSTKVETKRKLQQFRPDSYVVLLPSHCRAEPNTFYCFSPEYNRLDLVRHGSSTAVARRMNWVLLSLDG